MQESITSIKMKQKGTLSDSDALIHCVIDTLVWLTGPVIDDGIVPAQKFAGPIFGSAINYDELNIVLLEASNALDQVWKIFSRMKDNGDDRNKGLNC